MPLKLGILPYLRFFTIMSPMLIASYAIMQSAFNGTVKGVIFVAGAAIIMFLGKLISSSFPNRVPRNFSAACNIFETAAMGWGTTYSSPGPHQLFLWYTAWYICLPMFVNSTVNWSLFGLFIMLILGSAILRVWQLSCVRLIDVMLGALFGSCWGVLWWFMMSRAERGYDPPLELTYFNRDSDNQQCTIGPKAFRCKKLPVT